MRDSFFILLLALLCACLLRAEQPLDSRTRLWLGGQELSEGGCFSLEDGGTAVYDPERRELSLCAVTVQSSYRGAGLYVEGDLTVLLSGESLIEGEIHGIKALGDLTIYGGGSLTGSGRRSGAAIRGCLSLFDRAELTLLSRSGSALRWARLHSSPMNTVTRSEGYLQVVAPYLVLLQDSGQDLAGHPLPELREYDGFAVRLNQPVPEPLAPEREGYRFAGWYADAELTQPFDFTRPQQQSLTLYAGWAQRVFVAFDSWGGSAVDERSTDWGEPLSAPEPPARQYYIFAGWYSDPKLTQPFDPAEPQTQSRTVFAKWDKLADAVGEGVDVARYQGVIDWSKTAAAVDFAFIRLGFRGYGEEGTLNLDDNFIANIEGAQAAGMDVGVYFFSQAISEEEARQEAAFVLAALEPYALQLPVVMDFELASAPDGSLLGRLYHADLSGEEHGRICVAFCRMIEEHGYTAAVYAGRDMLESGVGAALELGGYPVWLANWTVQTRYNGDYTFWQYSSTGRVQGIEGEVDQNRRYVRTPAQVTGLTLRKGEGFRFLYWDRVPGVRGYIVYRRDPGSGSYYEVARLSGAATVAFTDYEGHEDSQYLVCAYESQRSAEFRGMLAGPVGG